ncbi:MAG: alcohol dehydrogenase catalytic domain-containing protein [Pseudonocardiaceae bacterium]
MGHEVPGVVARGKGAPVTVETVLVPDPGPSEVLVTVQACGVCHTDLHYREGAINDEFPFLLGHEAAGVVEAVGDGVDTVVPGDFVILNWRAVCGRCRACQRGEPWYCFSTHNAAQPMTLADGTTLSPALGIGAFIEKTLVHSGQCTNIGIDLDPRKLEWAKEFGATHTVDARESDVVEAVREHTGGFGADAVIDAVGRPETWEQAFFARDLADTVVLVGVPTPELTVPDIPLIEFFGRGGALKSSWYGDCLPERDFPMLIDLHLQGRLPLDKFVSETIGLDDVERAFEKMHHGEVLRSVVVL